MNDLNPELREKILEENRVVHRLEGPLYLERHPEQTNFFQKRVLRRAVQRVCKEMGSEDGQILDLGCGTGYLYLKFLERGYAMTGVDLSESMLDVLKNKIEDKDKGSARLICSDVESFLEESTENWSAIVASALLHHLYDPETNLKKMCDKLKPGGTLLIFFEPLRQSIKSPFRYQLHRLLTWVHEIAYRMEMKWRGIALFEEKYELADYQRQFGGIDPEQVAEVLRSQGMEILYLEKYCSRRYGVVAWIANRLLKSENTFNLLARKSFDVKPDIFA
jgi:ubiquinone/menaquinone biosynthesis C-methylase UbiE